MNVRIRSNQYAKLYPLPTESISVSDGFWAKRQSVDRHVGLRHGNRMLEEIGKFNNLSLAAGKGEGMFCGRNFHDSGFFLLPHFLYFSNKLNHPLGSLHYQDGEVYVPQVAKVEMFCAALPGTNMQ
jgi:hypothetical protein